MLNTKKFSVANLMSIQCNKIFGEKNLEEIRKLVYILGVVGFFN